MTNGRNVAIITAAIACVLTAPLAIGRADELSDLRANQELLQQRLDQLAQIPSPTGVYPGGPPAPSAGAGMVGGSFPRSFLIPGTDTSIRVGGEIRLNVLYFFNGGNPNTTTASTTNIGNNGALNAVPLNIHVPSAAGVARARGTSMTFISPQQSKVNFESRTPTAWGEARTFMEFDWANGNQFVPGNNALLSSNNLVPRFRFAYATLGGFLAGQANSNFSDADASAELISFGGPPGDAGVTRLPQVRYTVPLAPWGFPGAFSVSAELPVTDGWTPAAGLIASDATSQNPVLTTCTVAGVAGATCALGAVVNPFKSPAPDLTAAWYIPQPWGHMDFSVVVRPTLQVKDGAFIDKTYTGYGFHLSGDVKPGWFGWDRDAITWHFVGGDSIGRYLGGNSSEFALVTNYPAAAPGSAAAAANVLIKPSITWGGNVGYLHRWLPNLRSTVAVGIQHHDINTNLRTVGATGATTPVSAVCSNVGVPSPAQTGGGGCGLNKELITAQVNLIWNPVPFADFGIEYMWGHRQVVSNLKGDVNAVISRFRVAF